MGTGTCTTKIHLRVKAAGLPMGTGITPDQASGYLGFDLVIPMVLSPILMRRFYRKAA
jgi:hypothetical protein